MDYIERAKAIVDNNLFIHSMDREVYQHLEKVVDIYSSIEPAIHKDDVGLLTDAFKRPLDTDTMVTLRLLGDGTDYDWYVVIIKSVTASVSDNPLFELEFINFRYLTALTSDERLDLKKFSTLLSMYNNMYFEYSSEDNLFTLHSFINDDNTIITSEDLDTWSKAKMEAYPSSADCISVMVMNLKNGFSNFQLDMPNSDVFAKGDSLPAQIMCQAIRTDSSFTTVGIIRSYSVVDSPMEKPTFNNDRDPLLNILNKKSIIAYTKQCMARKNPSFYMTIFDLDNFKQVNDNFGHLEGDKVLCEVASVVKEQIKGYGVVGRIGGDELMIILEDIEDKVTLRNILRNIRTKIEILYKTKPRDYGVTCSMGAVKYPDFASTYEELFKLADKMLYLAKQKGKNRYIMYVPELHASLGIVPNNVTIDPSKIVTFTDKLNVSKAILEDYLTRRIITNATIVSILASTYQLDDVQIMYNNFETSLRYLNGNTISDIKLTPVIPDLSELESLYDESGIIAITGLYKIEATAPKLTQFLSDNKIQSAVIYRLMNRKETDGYILFAKCISRYQWTNEEILMFTTFGKAFELAMYNLT